MRKRHYLNWLLALLAAVSQGIAVQLAFADEAALSNRFLSHEASLAQLGYPAGLFLADNTLPTSYSLLYPLPSTMKVKEATLNLHYRMVLLQEENRELVLTINDQRRMSVLLKPDDAVHVLKLPVVAEEVSEGHLKITIEGQLPSVQVQCLNNQLQPSGVRFLPNSQLRILYLGEPESLRDFWLTLPREVRLSLPEGELDEELFSVAVAWLAMLRRNNHSVRIVRLPEVGEIVLASRNQVASVLFAKSKRGEHWNSSWDGKKNIGLIESGGRRLMVMTEPYPSAQIFSEEWPTLGASALLATKLSTQGGLVKSVPLSAFDIDSSYVVFRGGVQWYGTITPWKLPPGTRPETAVIKMKLPTATTDELRRIYVYLNERLAASELLKDSGDEYQLKVPFEEQRADNIYRMHVMVRSSSGKGCDSQQAGRIGIDGDSHLLVAHKGRDVREIAELTTVYGLGFDLIVPMVSRSEPERYLPLLGELVSRFAVPPYDYSLVFYEKDDVPLPARNFIMIASSLPQKMSAALYLDKGTVEIVDRRGELLVGDEQLRSNMLLQLARNGKHGGLWVYPGEQQRLPFINVGMLGSADVAVYAQGERAISIDTHQYGITHIRYVDAPNWIEHLYEERRLWLLGAWVVLTLVMLYLYVIPKRRRNL